MNRQSSEVLKMYIILKNSGMQDDFAQFSRNGRWGTCGSCPRDEDGKAFPELCEYTGRYDHLFDIDELVRSYKNQTKG